MAELTCNVFIFNGYVYHIYYKACKYHVYPQFSQGVNRPLTWPHAWINIQSGGLMTDLLVFTQSFVRVSQVGEFFLASLKTVCLWGRDIILGTFIGGFPK